MYSAPLCYKFGEGLSHSRQQARKWMKRAADLRFDGVIVIFSTEGGMLKAVVYLELAIRSGETAATHVKNVILQQLSATSRDRAPFLADNWRDLPRYQTFSYDPVIASSTLACFNTCIGRKGSGAVSHVQLLV
ncbi:hypothetical protein HRI_000747100 [Hibiscus trionum]|uniref:Uncharacterized protein n=1 Tax=Hibiscus trionum TaxID=183268 RepID=A0A9W7H5F8_HIBTR|nr:hypothetical protein HRI_000747100 [Hibiscus trionum]